MFSMAPAHALTVTNPGFESVLDPDLGMQLGIRVFAGGEADQAGAYFAFDDVRLTLGPAAVVPLAAGWLLFAAGGLVLGMRARRS